MNSRMIVIALMVSVSWTIFSGCDSKPSVPRLADGKPPKMLVASEPTESLGAQKLMDAHEDYRYRLMVLQAYYSRIGALYKQEWVERELKNFSEAQTFGYDAIVPADVAPGLTLEAADEATLAEHVVAARTQWLSVVRELANFYESAGQSYKAAVMQNVLARFDPVRTYMYFLNAEVPPGDLTPNEPIPEAEQLFAEAEKLHKDGKILPLVVKYNNQRQALLKFLELVRQYPSSDRVALSAYYIGDIYKEYFDEDYRAVLWYERAFQWDPNITKPARFQAAVLYDIRLHHRGKALELYNRVVEEETSNWTNVNFAKERIAQLTTDGSH